jgi:hypothetical protein
MGYKGREGKEFRISNFEFRNCVKYKFYMNASSAYPTEKTVTYMRSKNNL